MLQATYIEVLLRASGTCRAYVYAIFHAQSTSQYTLELHFLGTSCYG